MKTMKILLGYWLEILVGTLILIFVEDSKWFLFYFFIIFLITTYRGYDHLRKMIRVFQTMNDMRFLGITRNLGLTEEDGQKIGDELENKLTVEERESLYADMDDLGLK